MLSRTLGLLLLVTGMAIPAYAQETPFQSDPIEHYTSRALVSVIVLGLAVVLFSLFKYRGKTQGFASWGLLLASVLMFPAATGMVGTVLVFERAERVEFCASCHVTMQTYVDDLKNPESISLAAVHYQNRYIPSNQCYECHTSYGLHGTAKAKMSGLIDVYKYYTKTYTFPIKMREPYPNNDCLKCHSESAKWLPVHDEFKEVIFSNELTCMSCHGEQHPAHTLTPRTAKHEKQ